MIFYNFVTFILEWIIFCILLSLCFCITWLTGSMAFLCNFIAKFFIGKKKGFGELKTTPMNTSMYKSFLLKVMGVLRSENVIYQYNFRMFYSYVIV